MIPIAKPRDQFERARLDGQLQAIGWAIEHVSALLDGLRSRQVAIATALIFHNPLPPHATDEAERAADAALAESEEQGRG